MSATKMAILVGYVVLGAMGVIYAGSAVGDWSLRILLLLAVAHVVEMAVFYKRCQQAGGSMALHLFNVFLFGVFHVRELEQPGSLQGQ